MGCGGNCHSCTDACGIMCPKCQHIGMLVSEETANALLKDVSVKKDYETYICTTKLCDVIYYQDNQMFVKDDVKVNVWFKEAPTKMTICYCRDITFIDIMTVVEKTVEGEAMLSKEDIIKKLEKQEMIIDCLHKNPIGSNCDMLFNNAINYAYKIKQQNSNKG